MKNTRGMTLIEVIVAIAIIGIIAVGFFGPMASGFKNTVETKKFTEDSFKVQKDMEKKIDEKKGEVVDPDQPDTDSREIFGKTVYGHVVDMEVKPDGGSAHGRYTAFIPYIDLTYDVPIVESVSLVAKELDESAYSVRDSMAIAVERVQEEGEETIIELAEGAKDISFKGIAGTVSGDNHLMNVYTWYISPPTDTAPTNVKDYIVLKEWNEARSEVGYDKNDSSTIPNISENYDEFSLGEMADALELSDEELLERFLGRYLMYSVTPYSDIGRVGKEVFSTNAIYLKSELEEPEEPEEPIDWKDIFFEYISDDKLVLETTSFWSDESTVTGNKAIDLTDIDSIKVNYRHESSAWGSDSYLELSEDINFSNPERMRIKDGMVKTMDVSSLTGPYHIRFTTESFWGTSRLTVNGMEFVK